MLNQKLFKNLLNSYKTYGELREEVIAKSREILRNSKLAIFALHRDEITKTKKILDQAENLFFDLEKLFKREKKLRYESPFKDAAEEFIEARMFYEFLSSKNVVFTSKVKLSFDDYLGGICDLSGEILRKAVQRATEGRKDKVSDCKQAIQEIVGELIKFDLVGKLRPKYDDAKRNLRRIEEIVYDLKIREK
jgi:predicted translin family RNA/ssDNA-binding protein